MSEKPLNEFIKKHFIVIDNYYECKYCNFRLIVSLYNRYNLKRHMNLKHSKEEIDKTDDQITKDSLITSDNEQSLATMSNRTKNKQIAMAFRESYLPISVLETPTLKRILYIANPSFKLPKRQTVTQMFQNICEEKDKSLIKTLENVNFYFCK